MDIGRYLVEAHLREGRSVGELAAQHGIHRSWLYRLLARYRTEGEAGLARRSRAAHSQPLAVPPEMVERIVALRTDLVADGLDAGALTIHWSSGFVSSGVGSVRLPSHSQPSTAAYSVKKSYIFQTIDSLREISPTSLSCKE